jgi:hypothetical protein
MTFLITCISQPSSPDNRYGRLHRNLALNSTLYTFTHTRVEKRI